MPRIDRLAPLTLASLLLAACAGPRALPGDDAPTLKSLAARPADGAPPQRVATDEAQALQAWQRLLGAHPDAAQRALAMRRLGDLEMDRADTALANADATTAPDYRAAIARYEAYLSAYPQDPNNDRVLYQLARAHEQGGDLTRALQTLDLLVRTHPDTRYRDEAQFRRGELLFTARRYGDAELAYATVLDSAKAGAFRDRALYMMGWSQFKQGKLEASLDAFLRVLDGKLAHRDDTLALDALPDLSRADRELVEDTFRVTSLALENLQGAASIAPLVHGPDRASYQVRLYEQLAALYLKQDRPKDAADTYNAFAQQQPDHSLAPTLQLRVIDIYREAGFDQMALQARQDFVVRYGARSPYRQANPGAWARTQPQVQQMLATLAQHFHAAAQRQHQRSDVQAAVAAYEALLRDFPADADTPRQRFLLAELLFEDQRYAEAARTYEQAAYDDPPHARSADAGYAALLARAERLKAAPPEDVAALRRDDARAGVRFATTFAADPRGAAVLANAADTWLQLGDGAQAAAVARRLLAQPAVPANAEPRRVAHTVIATTAFDGADYVLAESASREALALSTAAPQRRALTERLAAALYKQGEAARQAGRGADAATLFERAADTGSDTSVRAVAQFDAAAQRLALKDWPAATRLLEDFRQRFPTHALQAQVPERLALAYASQRQWAAAAAEYDRVAAAAPDADRVRQARWLAADALDQLRQATPSPKARAGATQAWERYLRQFPDPLEAATEARARLAALASADGNASRALRWQRELLDTERAGAAARTARSRQLSAQAALALAEPVAESFRKVNLVEPLQKNLALKKSRLEEALGAYALAASDGVAEAVTAATFNTAALYQDFGKALMSSQRPRKLKGAELEQYNVMLEEQAYPFEEKAIEIHEINAHRTTEGVYDTWVQKSLSALRTLRPARWSKTERDAPGTSAVAALNQQAMKQRSEGDFPGARATWERALAQAPDDATVILNLGVLLDVYLDDAAHALPMFERYLALTPGGDAQVAKWVTELKHRKPVRAAQAAETPKER